MLIPIPNIDSNYRTGKIPTAKIQYRTTLTVTTMMDDIIFSQLLSPYK